MKKILLIIFVWLLLSVDCIADTDHIAGFELDVDISHWAGFDLGTDIDTWAGETLSLAGSPALTFINSASASAASGTAVSLTHGFTIASGDIVICAMGQNGSSTYTDNNPAGDEFTEIVDGAVLSMTRAVYRRTMDATEGSTFDFTASGSNRWAIGCAQYRPPDGYSVPAAPMDVSPSTANTGTDTTPTATGITVGVNNATVIAVAYIDGAQTFSAYAYPAHETIETDQPLSFCWSLDVSSGATGNKTWTLDGSMSWSAELFSLKPGE